MELCCIGVIGLLAICIGLLGANSVYSYKPPDEGNEELDPVAGDGQEQNS